MSIDYYLDLVADNYFTAAESCARCRGTGTIGDEWCGACDGGTIVHEWNPGAFLHNCAVAGALTKAFRLGDAFAWNMAWNDRTRHDQITDLWRPNCEGRAAP